MAWDEKNIRGALATGYLTHDKNSEVYDATVGIITAIAERVDDLDTFRKALKRYCAEHRAHVGIPVGSFSEGI